jgi:phosphoribosylanthranilate isomerase
MKLKIKICGMRFLENIREVGDLNPDLMGFIFYPDSQRYAGETLKPETLFDLPEEIKRVGVFVNTDTDKIYKTVMKYSLHFVQLHGEETPETCRHLSERGIDIIKAFNIKESEDFRLCDSYIKYTKYFLFDSFTSKHGGSGIKFDWVLLEKYNMGHPFFLSGGIALEDVSEIQKIANPAFYGIDLNSRFEVNTGLKDIGRLKTFISAIRNENIYERDIYSRR